MILISLLLLLVTSCAPISYKLNNLYIDTISTSNYKSEDIKKILDDFNTLGYNKIVKYEGKTPIYIEEVEYIGENKNASTIGQAHIVYKVSGSSCTIKVLNDLTPYTLRIVILHEYLHCLQFDHVDKDMDLMSPLLDYVLEENIQEWALKAVERLMNE